jgi:phosphate/sulfate permease
MKSWKTTSAGSITGAGMALMGINLVPGMSEAIPAQWRSLTILAGFILTVVGPVILGLVSRDNDKSSEQVGANTPEPPKEEPKA